MELLIHRILPATQTGGGKGRENAKEKEDKILSHFSELQESWVLY